MLLPNPLPPAKAASRRGWLKTLGSLLAGSWVLGRSRPATAGPTQVQGPSSLVGEIMMVAFGRTPTNWLPCDGRLLPVNQYQALYSLLGTAYGGNGQTTFGLPDLRGRVPINQGQGPGLQNYPLSSSSYGNSGGGQAQVTLTLAQLPAHTHTVPASTDLGTTASAVNDNQQANYLADSGSGAAQYATTATTQLASGTTPTGFGQAHENRQPLLCVNFLICVNGIYPTRN